MAGPAKPRPGQGRLALVTGGAGFIGSHIVCALLEHGWRVRVLDDFSTGSEDNLADAADAELVRADLCDSGALASAADGAELIFHQAAIASVPRSIEEPFRTHAVNLDGTLAVLEAARQQGCRRVVFASSSAVYGNGGEGGAPAAGISESQPPRPISPYAVQKLASEEYLSVYGELHGVETVAFRYFNVYGPRQDPHSDYAAVIPLFVEAALAGKPLTIHGDGLQIRDFVNVADVARANLLAADAPAAAGRRLNLASGRSTRILELASVIGAVLGRELEVVHTPARAGDIRQSIADTKALRETLDFEPEVDLETGIRRTIEALGDTRATRGASQ